MAKAAKRKVANKKRIANDEPELVKGEFGEIIKVELNSPSSLKSKPVKPPKKK